MWLVLLYQPFETLRVVSGIRSYKTSGKVEVAGMPGNGPIGYLPIFQNYDEAVEFADGDTSKVQEIWYD